ncbi:hypothetical protein Q3O98_16695 [Ralstonia pseudosolanacearum]|uniref:hypothetical protein n=1 Tax=Ralstonia pseudosolanacearum TaxID=1310165 RepID=UPI0026760836|nr:hypothetical protein [Ralstonia pseudosolanacearum]MDO3622725.1 hypothetical protein [Ralstonia pseudosolanacearum]
MELQKTSGTTTLPDEARWIEQLDALQPGKQQQKTAQFQTLYPAIERALAREVPQKVVLAELAGMGLSLSMGGFRSLLDTERKLREQAGEYLRCSSCHSILPKLSNVPNAEEAPSLASIAAKSMGHREQAPGGNNHQ